MSAEITKQDAKVLFDEILEKKNVLGMIKLSRPFYKNIQKVKVKRSQILSSSQHFRGLEKCMSRVLP